MYIPTELGFQHKGYAAVMAARRSIECRKKGGCGCGCRGKKNCHTQHKPGGELQYTKVNRNPRINDKLYTGKTLSNVSLRDKVEEKKRKEKKIVLKRR